MMYRPSTTNVRRATTLCLAFTSQFLFAGYAAADTATVRFRFNNEPAIVLEQTGEELAGGKLRFQGNFADPDGRWTVLWNYTLDPDVMDTASLVGHTRISNSTDATAAFDFRIASRLCPTIAWHALYGGQVAAHILMNENGGMMSNIPGSHVWAATADGTYAAGLFAPPFGLGGSGAGTAQLSANFGAPYPSYVGPGFSDEPGIRLRFKLTDGDIATINTSLYIASPPGNLVECGDSEPVGDFNGDGVVDVQDLFILMYSWGRCNGCPADLNMDGRVDIFDLIILLANWG